MSGQGRVGVVLISHEVVHSPTHTILLGGGEGMLCNMSKLVTLFLRRGIDFPRLCRLPLSGNWELHAACIEILHGHNLLLAKS